MAAFLFFILGVFIFLKVGHFPVLGFFPSENSNFPPLGRDTKEMFENGKYQILRGQDFYSLYDFSKGEKVLATHLINYDWAFLGREVFLIGKGSQKAPGFIYHVFFLDSGEIQTYSGLKDIPEKFQNNFKNLEIEIKDGSRLNFRLHPAFRR